MPRRKGGPLPLLLLAALGGCTAPNPFLGVCGNGRVEPDVGEECDDGEGNGDSGCTEGCKVIGCGDGTLQAGSTLCQPLSTCGDGVVEDGEECDDGNRDDGDACPATCLYPYCGNGVVEDGELCDDGNKADDDACPSACEPAVCGDGFVQAGVEECDDGNEDNNDACLTVCLAAVCGDGVIQTGVEECDDGNLDPDDGCNAACVRDRLVFIADEPLTPLGFQSLFGADNLCRKTAKDHGHPNFESFKAWLSDGEESPATRFAHSPGRYVQVTGEVVAESWEDLTDGDLQHGIDRTIDGVLRYEYSVWTSTLPTGEAWDDGLCCQNWTTASLDENGRQGTTGFTDTRWTDDGFLAICALGARLYCFQQ